MAGISVPIKLVEATVSRETGGNWASVPTLTKHQMFAELIGTTSGNRTYDGQTQLGQVKRFRIRFRFDLYPNGDWKIEFRGKEWTIISIEPEDDRLFHWIITANHK